MFYNINVFSVIPMVPFKSSVNSIHGRLPHSGIGSYRVWLCTPDSWLGEGMAHLVAVHGWQIQPHSCLNWAARDRNLWWRCW